MRLLLGSDHYPPFIGGAHIQTRLIAQELAARGHEVAVATPWHQGFAEVERDGPVAVHRLRELRTLPGRRVEPGVQQHHPPYPDPVTIAGLRRLVRDFAPDVVHAHGWINYSCAAALVGSDVPLIIAARDYAYGCPKRTLLHGRGEVCSGPAPRKCASCAGAHYGRLKGLVATAGVLGSRPLLRARTAGLHSVSTYVESIAGRDAGLQPPTRRVVPEAVPPEGPLTEVVAADLARLPEEPFMLFVGALRHEKGTEELLEAYARLRDAPLLVMIGTIEPDTPAVFPPGVVVLTDFSHGAVLRAWERALFGVFPSLLPEPLGTVVCEAMTQGRAVIGTRPGGHVDVIEDGVSGLLVGQGDVDGLAAALQRLIDDPAERARMGEAARVRGEAFRIGAVVARFEALYAEVLGDVGGGDRVAAPLEGEPAA